MKYSKRTYEESIVVKTGNKSIISVTMKHAELDTQILRLDLAIAENLEE